MSVYNKYYWNQEYVCTYVALKVSFCPMPENEMVVLAAPPATYSTTHLCRTLMFDCLLVFFSRAYIHLIKAIFCAGL